ncbi:hypothetical protein SAMN05421595_2822 [Austwickia chelonae]|uniref:Uncharacterized protein n=1 Tax=Austwickia chelonae NBRC 105200 TaxID=1184607 RepID=K6VTA6_9MICO|nr:hypothetical protein [Austwickia chelonae]GAB78545.1 hypothetical protein AUCHE_11_00040 [Austwickia chelonae NBRC 105200]SEW40641.1 hypothetical protein SAMN05421595_2822 [Austwickia chelonae]
MTSPRTRHHRRPVTLRALAGLLALAMSGCAPGGGKPADKTSTATGSASPSSSATAGNSLPPELVAALEKLPGNLAERSGLAALPVGGRGEPALWGALRTGPAWSTIKVPLSVAAGDTHRDTSGLAISQSDNEAAARLWTALGGGEQAASAVRAELHRGGDTHTTVQHHEVRPPYTPYGQTNWQLDDSARYTASLPCRPEAATTYAQMHHIAADQRWGLGSAHAEAYKGGWGPAVDQQYMARQIGVIAHPDGTRTAVALIVLSPGGYEQAATDLDILAGTMREHLDKLPSGRCTSPSGAAEDKAKP